MRPALTLPALFVSALALTQTAGAQTRYHFSIDWQSPTVGTLDPGGTAITEGDLLVPTTGTSMPALGPLPTPTIAANHLSVLGLLPGCVGHPGGTPCIVEVDAISRGADREFQPNFPVLPGQVLFSVDEFAVGIPAAPMPNVPSEAPVGDTSADSFTTVMPLPPAPLPPGPGRHVGVQDGDGTPSGSGFMYPGVGLREPNMPLPGPVDMGDNLDALDAVQPTPVGIIGPWLFSLDSAFADPLEGTPGSGSAAAHGFVGGDVLISASTGLGVYAPAGALGLDFVGGPDSDDLDALMVSENGIPGWQPSPQPYAWMTPNADMLIFSVRRGSAVIGMPDSIFGIPIEEGDLLVPPLPTALGGVSPFPGIFIAAENLGLNTLRSGIVPATFGDELDAVDNLLAPLFDCDGNGIEDAVDIATGTALDTNMNGIPDGCEVSTSVGTPFCFCPAAVAPCGNAFPAGGCLNVSGTGAILSGSGSTSTFSDDLLLTTSGMNPGTFALTIMGTTPIAPAPINNGNLCAAGSIFRFPPYPTGSGTASYGTGIVAWTLANNPPAGQITSGSTWHFQTWYRDFGGFCGSNSNLSNALSVTFTP